METTSLSTAPLANHYCFRGRRDLADVLEIGSPDALDAARGGSFDYVVCSRLSRFENVEEALGRMVEALRPGGALGLGLDARYGRQALSRVQALLRFVNFDVTDGDQALALGREVVRDLRQREPLPIPADAAAFRELYLSPAAHAWTVPEIYTLLEDAGLRFVAFATEFRPLYDAAYAFGGAAYEQIAKLPVPLQQAAAELYWGTVSRHLFWASREEETIADPYDPENVPFFFGSGELSAEALREGFLAIPSGQARTFALPRPGGVTAQFALQADDRAHQVVELIDGSRTMGAIAAAVAARWGEAPDEALRFCGDLLETFRPFDVILLRHRSVPA